MHKLLVMVTAITSLPEKGWVNRWTDCPDMTTAVDWEVKQQTKPEKAKQVVRILKRAKMVLWKGFTEKLLKLDPT